MGSISEKWPERQPLYLRIAAGAKISQYRNYEGVKRHDEEGNIIVTFYCNGPEVKMPENAIGGKVWCQ